MKIVPPKKSEEKEPKKRTGDGQMGYLRTRSTRENAFDQKKKGIKKMKDQLRYLMKKELAGMLSSKEKKIKNLLQKSLGMK